MSSNVIICRHFPGWGGFRLFYQWVAAMMNEGTMLHSVAKIIISVHFGAGFPGKRLMAATGSRILSRYSKAFIQDNIHIIGENVKEFQGQGAPKGACFLLRRGRRTCRIHTSPHHRAGWPTLPTIRHGPKCHPHPA